MKLYKVRMTKQANEHVLSYADYIQNILLNPQAARKFVNDIRAAVKSLGYMPQRNPLIEEEPWRSRGIHKMAVRGYIIYYYVQEESETVLVFGIVYGKRNQIEQLTDMNFEQ